jgi:hypothetical protein
MKKLAGLLLVTLSTAVVSVPVAVMSAALFTIGTSLWEAYGHDPPAGGEADLATFPRHAAPPPAVVIRPAVVLDLASRHSRSGG